MDISFAILFIEVAGTLTFAVTGIMEARRKKMDLIGVYTVAMVTAFGGGTLRDVFLQRYPLFWIHNDHYPVIILVLSLLSLLIQKQLFTGVIWITLINIMDALGLGLFSASGTAITLQLGYSWYIAAIMGVITATFGGVVRDILCNEIPNVFQPTQLYATCAFMGALGYIVGKQLGLPYQLALGAGILAGAGTRITAMLLNVALPKHLRS